MQPSLIDPKNYHNLVRDWSKSQGFTSAQDDNIQRRRDLDVRYITIENSSVRPVGIAITAYYSGPLPKRQFIVEGGEIKNLGINLPGDNMQFIWMVDPETSKPVGTPYPTHTNINSFVLRDGINKWFVQGFHRPSYAASK